MAKSGGVNAALDSSKAVGHQFQVVGDVGFGVCNGVNIELYCLYCPGTCLKQKMDLSFLSCQAFLGPVEIVV